MRVCLEATSLLGPRSGVGHTTAALAEALVEVDEGVEVVLLPLTLRGSLPLVAPRHPRITPLRPMVPARLASWVWARASWPPAELFCGAVDVYHGPNFLLPPLLKAAGVLTVHDIAFVRMPEACAPPVRAYRERVPVAVGRAARVIVPSAFTAGELASWLPEVAGRVRVCPMGVRRVFLAPGGPLSPHRAGELGVRSPYALFVGTLEVRKNLDTLLRAFATVVAWVPGAQLVLVGQPGVGWEDIARTHAPLLREGSVVVAGYLPDAEVAALVRGAKVFVYPSRYEGFGLPPLEALAAGTPVVAASAGALPETLGGHARLVDPGDAEGLALALRDAFEREPDPAALEAGRAWARAFTWERAARQTLRVYREAVEEVK